MNILKYAFVLAPLMMGCPQPTVDPPVIPAGGFDFPDCSDGQLVSTDVNGKLICLSAPTTKVEIKDCTANQALTSDGVKLNCVDKAQGGTENANNTRITNLTTKVDRLTTQATDIKNKGGGTLATYVGNTTGTYNGDFQTSITGAVNGFDGSAKACVAQFGAGAHLCTAYEIYYSAINGTIASGKEIAKAWVYFPAWKTPTASPQDPNLGVSDTCGSLTYPTGDLKWTGVAVSTGPTRTTRWGVRFHGGSEAPCSGKLPISCCK